MKPLFTLKAVALALTIAISTQPFSTYGIEKDKNKLPEIGTAAFSTLSLDKERQIGEAMMQQLRATQPIINDPVLIEYINGLGNQLVRHAQDVNYSFDFFLINSSEINAFAFFGGHVGVHSALITMADTESELASVLAHEISHVTQRHLARRLEEQNRMQSLTMTSMISSVLLALINPGLGFAALNTTMAASQQMGINFTRSNEKESDRVGITLLANSGFDPNAAPSFFQKLSEKYRYTTKPPAMLLTHPLSEERITDARNRAQNYPAQSFTVNLSFELAKARIKSRYQGEAKDNIVYFQRLLNKHSYAVKEAASYGLALAYYEDKQYPQAEKILWDLYLIDQKNLFYVDALSDVFIQLGEHEKALIILANLNLIMPNNQVVALNYANVLQERKKYDQAVQILQDYLLINPGNFIAYDLLTTIYQKQDKKALMHTSKAEILALLGAYSRAVDELQTAYAAADDMPLMKKRIKARILQLQEQENKLKRL